MINLSEPQCTLMKHELPTQPTTRSAEVVYRVVFKPFANTL